VILRANILPGAPAAARRQKGQKRIRLLLVRVRAKAKRQTVEALLPSEPDKT
jgi:hypothetical protein